MKDFILTLDDGSGDDLVYEVKFVNLDEEKYYFEPKDEDLKEDIDVLDLEKDDELIKSIKLIKREMKIGDKVKTCIYQENEHFKIEGTITEILESGIKILPDDEELIEIFSDELLPKEEVYFYDEEKDIYENCEGEKENQIEIFLFDNIDKNITNGELENLCNKIIPSLSEILKRKIEIKNKIYNNDDIKRELFKYNITVNNVHAEDYQVLKEILKTNISNYVEKQ